MSSKEKRRYERSPFDRSIKFYLLTSHTGKLKLKRVDCEGVSVDANEQGLGIRTKYPLKRGDTLFFEHDVKINKIIIRSCIVKWVREIENNRYRVGLQFQFAWCV